MFTLGNKEAIVNAPAQFPFTPSDASTAVLNIKGFGTFDQTKIKSAVARRASDAVLEKLAFTCPTAAALGIAAAEVGVAVVVHIRVSTIRTESEFAIDFIKRGRPIVLEIKVDGGATAATVAATTLAAFNEYTNKFLNITLPVTAALLAPASDTIVLTATAGHYQISENVSFLKRGDIFALAAVTTKKFDSGLTVNDLAIAPGDTTLVLDGVTGLYVGQTIQFDTNKDVDFKITEIVTASKTITFTPALGAVVEAANADKVYWTVAGVEAVNDGKYLEENVRMSNGFTADAYSINPGQVPIIGAKYTMVSFTIDPAGTAGGWEKHKVSDTHLIAEPMTFTLYFNEDTCVAGATSLVTYLLTWLDVSANVGVANFKKANGASAATIADFVA